MNDGKPDQRRAWFDLERFRSARAFGYGGCVLSVVLLTAAVLRVISGL
jgi:hypothetical protein